MSMYTHRYPLDHVCLFPLRTPAGRFLYTALPFCRTWAGGEPSMNTAPTITHVAARLCISCGSGLARMPISTPRATQRELTLAENVEGPVSVIRAQHRRA